MLPVDVFELDAGGNCTYTNAAWQEMAGLEQDEAMGLRWLQAVHPEDVRTLTANRRDAMKRALDIETEFRFVHADGMVRWIHSHATPILRDDQLQGYVGVTEDITERRRAVAEMKASLEEKEVLLREVHHRVKNNLQLVTSLLNLQAGYLKDPNVLAVFEDSQRRVRAMALVHEMLYAHTSLARIEIDLYLKQLAQTILRSFTDSRHRIEFEPKLAPLTLLPDVAIPLGIIVNELLTNACKHGRLEDHPLKLTLELSRIEPDGIALHFSDNGPGMPADFDPATNKSLGFRLITLLTKQLRASLDSPVANGPATYKLRLQTETQTHGS
jgi:PAS domain S-box-containing protein